MSGNFGRILFALMIMTGIILTGCAQKPVDLNFNPNAGETRPNQYRANITFGFVTFEDLRVSKRLMGDKTLIGWGSNTYHTNANVPEQVTKAFVDTYRYLGLKAVWIKNPPENFSFSTNSWVRSLRSLYPEVNVFVIGKIQNYEFLLRSGGMSGLASGTFNSLAVTTQARVELYYLDSETGRIIWGNTLHHDTYDRKVSKKAPVDYASIRLEDALQNVIIQSVDRVLPKINKRDPGAVQVLSAGFMADVPKTPEGKPAGVIPAGKGRLEIVSKPGGARVYVDGIYYGLTPLSLDLSPGVHLLKVHKDGFETSRDKVGILEGKSTPWNGDLPKKN
ncbi:MAG: PEGA domain-containing protein [Nitrospirae bacterium]|nr:MAG: pega protein [Leptospirillum sp. Group IV 'UBA BS']MCL4484777.1 PEGA domain-containing protein [Nitrospirota bacterium]MCL5284405.1 PEGA domain-containing protein [Nitrospirota bacterium]